MKRTMFILAIILVLGTFAGCAGKNGEGKTSSDENAVGEMQVFSCTLRGVELKLGEKIQPILDALGEADSVFESPSCFFDNLIDRKYSYNSFELSTFPDENEIDYLQSITFKDDSVSTPEGVSVGDPVDRMKSTYGADFKESREIYTYTKGRTMLKFGAENHILIAITYEYMVQ